MWFKTIFSRRPAQPAAPLFDEAFLRRLERLGLQTQRALRGQPNGGEHPSRQLLPTTVMSDHRPYSAGDDYRYIDWNAYAHQDQPLIKLGEVEQQVAVHLLLDMSRSMAAGAGEKLRTGRQLAAALGYLALSHQDRLTVTPFGAAAGASFGPASGKGRLMELLRFLEAGERPGQTVLGTVLRGYARVNQRGGLLVLISDLLTPEALDAGLALFAPPRWQVLVLHTLAPSDLDPGLLGPAELEDAESGALLPLTVDDAALAIYRQNLAAWLERTAAACRRRGAVYARLPTDWPLERQVVPYLRARRVLR